jgi:hypothetical protein
MSVRKARSEILRSPGDSLEQQEAEELLIKLLGERLDLTLAKKRFPLPEGGWLEVDGVSESPAVLCEAWAHIGMPKSAQKNKVMADALKLRFAATLCDVPPERLLLVLADKEAASHFTGKSWMAQALRANRIEIDLVELPEATREAIRKAQARQYR